MRILLLLFLVLAGSASAAGAEIDTLSEHLIGLRAEVDELQSKLDIRRHEHKARMASLATQIGDLENQRNHRKTNFDQLNQRVSALRSEIADSGATSSQILPALGEALALAEAAVEIGIPFKIAERKAVLQGINDGLASGDVDGFSAVNRLWSFAEDELRLSRENGIYSQTIELNDQFVLVEIAKIGTVMMYFRTDADQFGLAQRLKDEWRFRLVEENQAKTQIATLFDSLRKQIRQGYFNLPNPLES